MQTFRVGGLRCHAKTMINRVSFLSLWLGSVGWLVGREYRLTTDRLPAGSPSGVTILVEAQTLSGLEVGVRLGTTESELWAPGVTAHLKVNRRRDVCG